MNLFIPQKNVSQVLVANYYFRNYDSVLMRLCFKITVTIDGVDYVGRSRYLKKAKKIAAFSALQKINDAGNIHSKYVIWNIYINLFSIESKSFSGIRARSTATSGYLQDERRNCDQKRPDECREVGNQSATVFI